MSAIHQFVPMLHRGDAVGRHTLGVQAELVGRGIESGIFVEIDDPETTELTRPMASYDGTIDDVLVYQFATASDLADWLGRQSQKVVVNYHNVTPAPLFAPWDNELARHQERAGFELGALGRRCVLGVAVSEFNRDDLRHAGFGATAVVPPVVAISNGSAERVSDDRPRSAGARWLAVGRLAPNKAVEDIIMSLLAFRTRHDPTAELVVVGKPAVAAYAGALRRFSADLGLADAVRFTGLVDDEALATAYRTSDVLVVASEHEGFCLPVVEAMANGLPVVAYREGAVPETTGEAAVLLDSKDPLDVADAVQRLQRDRAWRAQVVEAGRQRVPALGLASAATHLADLLEAVRDGASWPASVSVEGPAPDGGEPVSLGDDPSPALAR